MLWNRAATYAIRGLLVGFLFIPSANAVDINYYPQKDKADAEYQDSSTTEKVKLLPGQRPSEVAPKLDKSDITQPELATDEPEEGWSVKAPNVASDSTSFVKNQRESVRRAEERMREQQNDDDDPLNPENYRISIEAEYKF